MLVGGGGAYTAAFRAKRITNIIYVKIDRRRVLCMHEV
jgi:hypothetical protein